MMARLITSLMFVVSTAVSGAPEHPGRQPTGKWVVDFDEKMCALQREYGTSESLLTLAFVPTPMSDNVTVYVFDERAGLAGASVPVKVGFGPGSKAVEGSLLTFDMVSRKMRNSSTGLARDELNQASSTGVISIDAGKRLTIAFQVPELRRALEILDECVVDLMDQWGFSREQQRLVAKRAESVKPFAEYLSPDDYPREALERNEMGMNSARFSVDRAGRTRNCRIVQSSGSKALDHTLCRVAARVRYQPAMDRDGNQMESIGFVRTIWWLE